MHGFVGCVVDRMIIRPDDPACAVYNMDWLDSSFPGRQAMVSIRRREIPELNGMVEPVTGHMSVHSIASNEEQSKSLD